MRPEIEQLLVLQDRDQKLAALRAEQRSVPREQAALQAKLSQAQQKLELVRQRGREAEVERRKLEGEVQSKQTAIQRFRTQQQATRKNEEYQGLTKEIQHAEDAIRALEDRELELMETGETLTRQLAAEDEEFRRAAALITRQTTDLQARAGSLDGRIAGLETERTRLAEAVPAPLLELYARLMAKKGDAALVALAHEVCAGCHMKAPAQVVAQLRIGGTATVQCPNCGRLLYREI